MEYQDWFEHLLDTDNIEFSIDKDNILQKEIIIEKMNELVKDGISKVLFYKNIK